MKRSKPPPVNLYKYLEGRSRNYVIYEDGARMYGMTYWGFVRLCQEMGKTTFWINAVRHIVNNSEMKQA